MREEQDDIFHSIVMSEERSQEEGYNEGKKYGRLTGIQEGYVLGWEKGSSIGSEVGFYSGYSKSLLEELRNDPDATPNQRVIKSLERIGNLCQQFPLTNPLHPDLQSKLEELRAKFKQVCSMLGIKPEEKRKEKGKGISF